MHDNEENLLHIKSQPFSESWSLEDTRNLFLAYDIKLPENPTQKERFLLQQKITDEHYKLYMALIGHLYYLTEHNKIHYSELLSGIKSPLTRLWTKLIDGKFFNENDLLEFHPLF